MSIWSERIFVRVCFLDEFNSFRNILKEQTHIFIRLDFLVHFVSRQKNETISIINIQYPKLFYGKYKINQKKSD